MLAIIKTNLLITAFLKENINYARAIFFLFIFLF